MKAIHTTQLSFPPGPATRSPVGQLFAFARDPLRFLVRTAAEYGDLAHFKIRKRDVFLVSHPNDIEGILATHARNFVKNPGFQTIKRVLGEGLLSSEGDFHLRQRRMIQPAFHRQQVRSYGPVMAAEAQKVSDRWQAGETVDIFEEMVSLTLNVVTRALFHAEGETEWRAVSRATDDAMTLFHHATSPVALLADKLPWIGGRRFRSGKKRLDTAIYGMIEQRREKEIGTKDLLSRLIAAQDDERGGGMTDTQVRDEALTILLAGHETTATGLAWTWYLLSQHPNVESALHAELDAVLQGRPPTVDEVSKLTYTRMVFSEALRLYPPIYMLGRQALEDYPIGEFVIPRGASLIVSPYIVHRDARFYEAPERFEPLRWTPEMQAGRHKFAYFPFGGGPRVCIGEPFAWQEAILALATLAQQWRLRRPTGQEVEVLPRVTLRPKGGIRMMVERRGSNQKS